MHDTFQRGKGRREPLPDELPYEFLPPRISRFWFGISRGYVRGMIRKQQGVREIEVSGAEHLTHLLGTGDGILLAPNHANPADAGVIYELSHQVRRPFCYMAAYQIFTDPLGFRRYMLPRLGVFPVDREGTDRRAIEASLDVLTDGQNPLVIFPEGEIYYMADRLTPLREGAAALALSAARKLRERGKTLWIVPAAIKYRYLDDQDPLPTLARLLARLEAFFGWSAQPNRPLLERLYRLAEGMLGLKELEYLNGYQSGPLPDRIARLTSRILDEREARWLGRRCDAEPVPERVKGLRQACLKVLLDPTADRDLKARARRDLDDLFVCLQLFSYPGDYVRACPTVERLAETLAKFELDVFGVPIAEPHAPRRALLRIGEPIDVRAAVDGSGGRPRGRDVAGRLTALLEGRIQEMLDVLGPGRPLPPEACGIRADPTPADLAAP